MKINFFIAMAVILAIGSTLTAQEQPVNTQGWAVWEDAVIPAKANAYEEAVKMHMANFRAQSFPYAVNVFRLNNYHYLWSVAIDQFADMDTLYKHLGKVYSETADETNKEIESAYQGTYEYSRPWTCVWHRNLSYNPEIEEGGSGEPRNYWTFGFMKVLQGKGDEMREVFREWAGLYEKQEAPYGYNFYIGDMGTDMPFMFWTTAYESPLDERQKEAEVWEYLGEEGYAVWEKTEALMRGFEQVSGWYRDDLSYDPEED